MPFTENPSLEGFRVNVLGELCPYKITLQKLICCGEGILLEVFQSSSRTRGQGYHFYYPGGQVFRSARLMPHEPQRFMAPADKALPQFHNDYEYYQERSWIIRVYPAGGPSGRIRAERKHS